AFKGCDGAREELYREHDVERQREFGFGAACQIAGTRPEPLRLQEDCPGLFHQCRTGFGQLWKSPAALEEKNVELAFQARDSLTDRGLGSPEPAAGSGEAPFVHCRNESPYLIEGQGIQHVSLTPIVCIWIYSLPRWKAST